MIINSSVVDVQIMVDGVYVVIDNPPDGPKASRKDVLGVIESFGVKDIDFNAVNEIFKDEGDHISKKISANTSINKTDETVTVNVSKSKKEAYLKFNPPVGNGGIMSLQDIRDAIAKAGVVYGVKEDVIEGFGKGKNYKDSYLIASGDDPFDGEDGSLFYHFETGALSPKPKINEDGTVDYHQLGIIKKCDLGDELITAVAPKAGQDGKNVLGEAIPAKDGKEGAFFPKGRNTVVSDDGMLLYAGVSGQIMMEGGKVAVSPVIEVKGDVDNSTGDIDFNGSVIIRGNVLSGFSVRAAGDIEVMGVVEGAYLKSEKNIILYSGVRGGEKAIISSDGNITAKFFEGSNVTANGSISADSIMHSNVKCGGALTLTGRKGLLVGGSCQVFDSIEAKNIGSHMATVTVVEIGHDLERLDKYRELIMVYESVKKEYDMTDKAINALAELLKKGKLPEDKKPMLIKSIQTKNHIGDKLKFLQDQINDSVPVMKTDMGYIRVSGTINSGVKVLIGDALLYVRDTLSACTLRNIDGRVSVGPY